MTEQNLIISLITSTEFIQRIEGKWNYSLIESSTAKRIAMWCVEYYNKYHKAPGKNIEGIFYEKAKTLEKGLAAEIEEEILPMLSDKYEDESFNIEYLVDQAFAYFSQRTLTKHTEQIQALLSTEQIQEAERLALSYTPLIKETNNTLDTSKPTILEDLERAFSSNNECLIKFEGALGEFWNMQFYRGAFVALMGAEKRGKTYWLLEFAMRACKQGRKVAFFQAGDMTKDEQLIRMAVYLARKSESKKYCGKMLEPIKDCIFNQTNNCTKKEREFDDGCFEPKQFTDVRKQATLNDYKKAFKESPEYIPCHHCDAFNFNQWGVPWYKEIDVKDPLTLQEAQQQFEKFFLKYKRQFKISDHPSGTLSVRQSEVIMDIWEREDGFIPDIIIYDYPDIMEDEIKEFRHKQNSIWMKLRGVSQHRHALVLAVTQTDADSYEQDLLKLKNFSEDKRKYAHPTAVYGLNQDHTGREKELGIMRINEIVGRKGDFNFKHQIYVLQNLKRGRPFITSYW